MNIVIAPDSFKECLTATEVSENIAKGILNINPNAKIKIFPISDGGEGLLESLVIPFGGKIISVNVKDPLERDINSQYGILKNSKTAVIELAKASGLELLDNNEKNPLITTTYGTGQLIKDALDRGCRKFLIGLGGSATNDGGSGIAKALGAKFLNNSNKELKLGGGYLNELNHIDLSNFDERIKDCDVKVACDVTNPLTGINGASFIYGAQKGGSSEDLKILDNNLKKYAKAVKSTLNKNIDTIAGAGAAGGSGAGLMAFLNAKLVNGIELILETLQIEEHVKKADLVITGEGKIDKQTLSGKTVSGISKMAKKHQVPVFVITGKIGEDIKEIYNTGVTAIFSIVNQPMELSIAIKNANSLIISCTENIMRTIQNFKV